MLIKRSRLFHSLIGVILLIGLLSAAATGRADLPSAFQQSEAEWDVDYITRQGVGTGRSFAAAFSSDGRLVALGAPGGFRVYDRIEATERWSYSTSLSIETLAWSPNGAYVAAGTSDAQYPEDRPNSMVGGLSDGMVLLFDASNGKELWSLPAESTFEGAIFDLAFSPDSTRLAYASLDAEGPVIVDAVTGQEIAAYSRSGPGPFLSVAWSPDGGLIAGGYDTDTTALWDVDSGDALPMGDAEWRGIVGSVVSVAFSPNSQMVASGAGADPMYIFDAESGALLQTLQDILEPNEGANVLAFSPDGALLAAGNVGGIVLWDTDTWQQIAILSITNPLTLSFSQDGRLLIATQDGIAHELAVTPDTGEDE